MALLQGYGGVLAATSAALLTEFDAPAIRVELFNRGPGAVVAAINCTADELTEAYTAGTAIRIEPGFPFSFVLGADGINSVCVRRADALDAEVNLFAQPASFTRSTAGLRNLSDVLPLMMADLPGCPDTLKLSAVRDVWREFCRRTQVWRETWDVDLAASTVRYELPIPDHAELVAIRRVWIRSAAQVTALENGTELDPDQDYDIAQDANGVPTCILQSFLTPGAAVTDGLRVEAALSPLPPAMGGSDVNLPTCFTEWADAVIAGATARLAAEPERRWTSNAMVTMKTVAYRDGINRALGVVARGRGSRNLSLSA
ncbi:MAG: hypothetical protein KJ579_01015 [Verrucomicrobia bacterium]|nr:hypothetical protein [Verrucomicrobiota bacterium]